MTAPDIQAWLHSVPLTLQQATIDPRLCQRLLGPHAKSLQSCPILYNTADCRLPGSSVHGDSPGKNTGVGCHALLQGSFPIQGSSLRLTSIESVMPSSHLILHSHGVPCSDPGSGRSPGGGHGNPLQYSCLENPMDRGAWWLQSLGSQRVGHNCPGCL